MLSHLNSKSASPGRNDQKKSSILRVLLALCVVECHLFPHALFFLLKPLLPVQGISYKLRTPSSILPVHPLVWANQAWNLRKSLWDIKSYIHMGRIRFWSFHSWNLLLSNLCYKTDSEVLMKMEWMRRCFNSEHSSDLIYSTCSETGKMHFFYGGNELWWEGRMQGTSWINLMVKARFSWNFILRKSLTKKKNSLWGETVLMWQMNQMRWILQSAMHFPKLSSRPSDLEISGN